MADKAVEKCIKDFRNGDFVRGFFFIRLSEMKTTATNNKYMNFTFSDNSGEINAKLWDSDEENVRRFPAGVIIKAEGRVTDWQGQLQFKIERIRRSIETDGIAIEQFIPSAPESGMQMLSYIEEKISQMQSEDLRKLTSAIITHYRDRLLVYPAAKANHHSVRGGLLYHTTSMLKAAEGLLTVYDYLNRDLLYAGVILHDIGKIEEMEIADSGLVDSYSVGGVLLGHITQGVVLISEFGKREGVEPEIVLLLQHMILSHHYIPEHGSPKMPHFPEAEMLHYLDILDARMYDMKKAFESTDAGNFSERLRSLDNRMVYKSGFHTGDGSGLPAGVQEAE